MGRETTRPSEPHPRLGRGADQGEARLADEVHVGAGVDLAQHPVEVERVGVEVEVEALRQHHLEDVARQDVLAGHLDGPAVQVAAHGRMDLGQLLVGLGRLDEHLVDGPGAVDRQLVQPADRGAVQGRERVVVGPPGCHHVVDEHGRWRHVLGRPGDYRHDGVAGLFVLWQSGRCSTRAPSVAQVAHTPAAEVASGSAGVPLGRSTSSAAMIPWSADRAVPPP